MVLGAIGMASSTAIHIYQRSGMTNPYIDSRRSSLTERIADLIFLLNQLEKNNPHIFPNGTSHHFEYRLAQYQQVKYPDA